MGWRRPRQRSLWTWPDSGGGFICIDDLCVDDLVVCGIVSLRLLVDVVVDVHTSTCGTLSGPTLPGAPFPLPDHLVGGGRRICVLRLLGDPDDLMGLHWICWLVVDLGR
jgi:hypothetical protein